MFTIQTSHSFRKFIDFKIVKSSKGEVIFAEILLPGYNHCYAIGFVLVNINYPLKLAVSHLCCPSEKLGKIIMLLIPKITMLFSFFYEGSEKHPNGNKNYDCFQ